MSFHKFEILAMLTELENESVLSEALLFPELNRLEGEAEKALANLRDSMPGFLDELPTVAYHTKRAPAEVETRELKLQLQAPKRSENWKEPVPLTFPYVLWSQNGSTHAFVPGLTIEVVAEDEQDLEGLLERNIVQELQRRGVSQHLGKLIYHQRSVSLKVERSEVELKVDSPKKKVEALTNAKQTKAVLAEVATNLLSIKLPQVFHMEEQVKRLAEMLVGRHGRSVLLVGPAGVGKTALSYELVRRRRAHHLGSTKFWETTGARLMVGADSFGDWQQRCRDLVQELSGQQAVLFLGNLFELAEVARHSTTPQGMAGFFRPYIERGELLCVVECTPQQRDILERDHPHLFRAFSSLKLEAPNSETVRDILRQSVKSQRLTEAGIHTIEGLHRRFARYSAYPGRPLRFLQDLNAEVRGELGPSQVAESFSLETGLPQFLIDESQTLDLDKTLEFFSRRILGQSEAVRLVVDLIASVKASLTPPGRPIASLLFIGPTGVGKTEMARTLAQYLFQDRQRMVRFDMSEYADPYSVERLVGGQGGGQGLLTSKVREQPFGVVLFDELEKADPSFFDLLLQILGEGRLTDEGGRLADFTNSVIVMTSNLGAGSFSKGPLGFRKQGESDQQARQQFTSAVKAAFRPELFNRIDRLVPFAPLSREIATKVAEREIEGLYRREGLERGQIELLIGEGVAEHLAILGYDRRYGARPLKRAIQEHLLEPLSAMIAKAGEEALKVTVELVDEKLSLSSKVQGENPKKLQKTARQKAAVALDLRREAQKILGSRQSHALRNQIHRLKRLESRKKRNPYLSQELLSELSRLESCKILADKLDQTLEGCIQLENRAVLSMAGFEEEELPPEALQKQSEELTELTLDLYASNFATPNRVTVLLFPEKEVKLGALLGSYLSVWEQKQYEFQIYLLTFGARENEDQKDDPILRIPYAEELENRALWCEPISSKSYTKKPFEAIAVELKGPYALPLMSGESGLHLFGSSNARSVEVVVQAEALKKYEPAEDLHLRKVPVGVPKRRHYNHVRGLVEDPRLDVRKPWNGKQATLYKLMPELMDAELKRLAKEACS